MDSSVRRLHLYFLEYHKPIIISFSPYLSFLFVMLIASFTLCVGEILLLFYFDYNILSMNFLTFTILIKATSRQNP